MRRPGGRGADRSDLQPDWLTWAQRIAAIAQTGLAYTTSDYDRDRYTRLADVAAEMLAVHTDRGLDEMVTAIVGGAGYATPKIDVRGVVVDDAGGVLLVRERSDGRWALPGGFADVGEGPRLSVEREIAEESGYQARARRLLAVWDRSAWPHPPALHQVWKIIVDCELVGGAAATSMETDDVGFFPPDALPPLSTVRILPEQIARALQLRADPSSPVALD